MKEKIPKFWLGFFSASILAVAFAFLLPGTEYIQQFQSSSSKVIDVVYENTVEENELFESKSKMYIGLLESLSTDLTHCLDTIIFTNKELVSKEDNETITYASAMFDDEGKTTIKIRVDYDYDPNILIHELLHCYDFKNNVSSTKEFDELRDKEEDYIPLSSIKKEAYTKFSDTEYFVHTYMYIAFDGLYGESTLIGKPVDIADFKETYEFYQGLNIQLYRTSEEALITFNVT